MLLKQVEQGVVVQALTRLGIGVKQERREYFLHGTNMGHFNASIGSVASGVRRQTSAISTQHSALSKQSRVKVPLAARANCIQRIYLLHKMIQLLFTAHGFNYIDSFFYALESTCFNDSQHAREYSE